VNPRIERQQFLMVAAALAPTQLPQQLVELDAPVRADRRALAILGGDPMPPSSSISRWQT